MYSVVIVEDHPVMREALATILGMDPSIRVSGLSASAEEGLDLLATLRPDLVLVDVSLPDMSGIDLIQKLSAERPELKFLVVSGHNAFLYAGKAREAGARGFVTKDNPVEVVRAVKRVLEGSTVWNDGE